MSFLSFRLPGPAVVKQRKPFTRSKQLQQWIESLPMANGPAAANQLLLQLRAINQADYSSKDRFQWLHELQPLSKKLVASLRQNLKNASVPLKPQQLQMLKTLQQLFEEQAVAYKIIITEIDLQGSGKKHSPWILQESIYLAIKYLARQLVLLYAFYQPESKNIWHELHQLFRYAEEHNLISEAIDDTDPDTPLPVQHTIEHLYKCIVLLRLTEPYHLLEGEVDSTYQLITRWAEHCEFHPLGSAPPHGEYIIDQASDLPPRYIPQDIDCSPQQGIIVDIRDVQTELEKYLQYILRLNMNEISLDGSTLVDRGDRDMLLRLGDALSARLIRRSKRFPLEGKVQATLGLDACHYHLANRTVFTPQMDELKLRHDTQEKLHPDDSAVPFAEAYREALDKDREYSQQSFSLNPWMQRNISPVGISLTCHTQCAPLQAKVGQIAAYRLDKKQNLRWQLGVVRWLRAHPSEEKDEGSLELGIMNIANGAVPIGIKAIQGVGTGTDYFRGLMIPRQVSIRQSRCLIVPALMYDINTVIAVNMKQRMFYIKLTNMLLATRDFAQFEFEILKQPPDFLF